MTDGRAGTAPTVPTSLDETHGLDEGTRRPASDMTTRVRPATRSDLTWLVGSDRHVDRRWVSRCVANREYLICEREGARVGFLRYSFFWGTIPYMDMIFILDRHRCRGAGTALVAHWETEMRSKGFRVLMTSSSAEETEPQAWHRRNGFQESGRLTFGRHEPSPETFFVKNL